MKAIINILDRDCRELEIQIEEIGVLIDGFSRELNDAIWTYYDMDDSPVCPQISIKWRDEASRFVPYHFGDVITITSVSLRKSMRIMDITMLLEDRHIDAIEDGIYKQLEKAHWEGAHVH